MAMYLEVFGVVAVLEWGETSTLGRVAGTTFLSRNLMDPILSTLYAESSPLEEGEEHPDMVSTSDSYPSLWCSITSTCVWCVCACGVCVRVVCVCVWCVCACGVCVHVVCVYVIRRSHIPTLC